MRGHEVNALPKNLGNKARVAAAAALLVLLAACGGAKEDTGETVATLPPAEQPTAEAAARFLTQATFGPNQESIDWVRLHGQTAWVRLQLAAPQTPHRAYLDAVAASFAGTDSSIQQSHFRESFWTQALTGPDQLRQRAAFALSQIFVVSFADSNVSGQIRGVATFYDMLGEKAFGNYRDLLEAVTLHPVMGQYLTMLRNQKEDGKGRVPDENYAREIMQLFSIGLYELNNDGTYKGGTPTETYTHEDIQGLAKVFTGWSWYAGPNLADRTNSRFGGGNAHPDRDWMPMQAYANYHSVSEKKFLGVTIPAAAKSDAEADLKLALDTLYNHPNVGPFLGKLLIQRLVTSNPSPAYVSRVANAFNNNGQGVRGDMKAVFTAVLLDAEARSYNAMSNSTGKVREPVLRLSSLLRATKATSVKGTYPGIDDTDNPVTRLGQTVLRSPTVFNFFRPGYTPPGSDAAKAGFVVPELQLTNEVSVAGYLNYIRSWISANKDRDVQPTWAPFVELAEDVPALVDRVNLLLMSGQMPEALRTQIVASVEGRTIRKATATNAADVLNDKTDRVRIAFMLAMASPDYLIQK
jgi:uncharacterized protein (DUF1800 family)